jgi:hypothetical protein
LGGLAAVGLCFAGQVSASEDNDSEETDKEDSFCHTHAKLLIPDIDKTEWRLCVCQPKKYFQSIFSGNRPDDVLPFSARILTLFSKVDSLLGCNTNVLG